MFGIWQLAWFCILKCQHHWIHNIRNIFLWKQGHLNVFILNLALWNQIMAFQVEPFQKHDFNYNLFNVYLFRYQYLSCRYFKYDIHSSYSKYRPENLSHKKCNCSSTPIQGRDSAIPFSFHFMFCFDFENYVVVWNPWYRSY